MQLDREHHEGNRIRSCEPGQVQINEQLITGPVIVSAAVIKTDWCPADIASMDLDSLAPVIAEGPELILLGTGRTQRFPPGRLLAAVMQRGIGIEVMDTAAACRTFNVLASEGRAVVAALLID